MIPYDCDLAPICTGPAPFDANVTPCCDEHEEEWTRSKVTTYARDERGYLDLRLIYHLANTIGVHWTDALLFEAGHRSLTYPARLRIRGVLG